MLVYVAGAGAMGCRFAAQIQDSGQAVTLLESWEENIAAIQANGVKITGSQERTVEIPLLRPQEAEGIADLIILFVKSMQLEEMLGNLQHLIGPQTKVLCLLNGLGHEATLRRFIPKESIMMGVTIWTAGLVGPGHVHLEGSGEINIADSRDPQVEAIVAMLNRAGLNVVYDEAIDESIWRKACVNGTLNSNCAALDCRIGELFAPEEGKELMRQIIHEFVQVARLENVDLDEAEIVDYVFETAHGASHHYPSMHQDLVQHQRLTEIDYLNGYVAQKGSQAGIQTPYCQYITQLIHTKESYLVK